jgi:hypothetical protein
MSDIFIFGNVEVISANTEVTGIISSNKLIKYASAEPPSNSYTTHFGPIIQGTFLIADLRVAYPMNVVETAARAGQFSANLENLKVKIKKKCATSKIKITCAINFEVNNTAQENTVVALFRNPGTLSESEIGSPTGITIHAHGLQSALYNDTSGVSTPARFTFIVLDSSATSAIEYTYMPRIYHYVSGRIVYLNRTVQDDAFGAFEQSTSFISLEEVI